MDFLKVGTIRLPIRGEAKAEYVPHGVADANSPPEIVQTIKWLMQKDLLRQDVFLIGVPGYLRSHITLGFLELANKEFEYLSITRDTTESDIKQRREIREGTAFYSDSSAVNAALNGRVLLIDGVEKAERNVLPILNNLLENREMQLEDGRFLMAAERFDKLLKQYTPEQLKEWRLERVSDDFSVIALGLAVPPFTGHTLDPPLRSRFQCRNIGPLPYETMLALCSSAAPKVDGERLRGLLSLVYGLNSQQHKSGLGQNQEEGSSSGLDTVESMPLFPVDSLLKAVRLWNTYPSYSQEAIFNLCYPSHAVLKENQRSILADFFKRFSIELEPSTASTRPLNTTSPTAAKSEVGRSDSTFVSTPAVETHLAEMAALAGISSDFCLLAPRGSGKTTLVHELAQRLGYDAKSGVETMVLYQDMNSRELLQQRRMLPDSGDTVWEDSQLVTAAKEGSICVLDGLERVHWSMGEMLAPFIHHRFLQLPDGSRLVSQQHYSMLKQRLALSDTELTERRKIFPISDRFRLIALGDSESASKWLNDQLLSLFLFHTLQPMEIQEELAIIRGQCPNGVDEEMAGRLLHLAHSLRQSSNQSLHSVATNSLSLRRIIFLAKYHSSAHRQEGLEHAIRRSTLARFMPSVVREAFEAKMQEAGLLQTSAEEAHKKRKLAVDCEPADVPLSSGNEALGDGRRENEKISIHKELMVPDILYYDNAEHSRVLSEMTTSFHLGYHLLLIGNQGVGKNKVADRFLQTTNRPRKYIQLHRDTTVQSLTVQTSVEDGVLKYTDSPLVQSVRDGFVLVIDEADKAPLHVIAILKSLLDSSALYLADGRRILPVGQKATSEKEIETHPDFRLVMLANRPGFPFAGNDLFSSLGDLFSVHIIDNPSRESEIQMLKRYGPSVPVKTLDRLAALFAELREKSDSGLFPYPYSTRELVAVVKHLERFPNDQLEDILANVFDFDAYSTDTAEVIREVFEKHRIAIGQGWWRRMAGGAKGEGAAERLEIEKAESDFDLTKLLDPKIGKVDPNNVPHAGGNTWAGGTGGYSTAGLGGVGGPFRLDAGHNVHQMSETAKRQVPDEVLKKARQVAQAEYKKRLKEIEMSEYDAKAYQEIYTKIGKQVKLLKSIVESLEAKEHERQWAKHQTSGDFDDAKLIEGVTGEKTIYRRRMEAPPEPGTPQSKPKRLKLCFDVSGSMYRFNGLDKRLEKSLESALLVMEAFKGMEDKISYDIVGHSGDGPDTPFVKVGHAPTNEKQRFDVLKRMLLHTQFCWSGDSTLEAIELASAELKKGSSEADESIVVVLSDANIDRYGITPSDLAEVMEKSSEGVNTFLVLIGSLGEQAQRLQRALPPGKSFVAKSAIELPEIIQKIFTSTLCK